MIQRSLRITILGTNVIFERGVLFVAQGFVTLRVTARTHSRGQLCDNVSADMHDPMSSVRHVYMYIYIYIYIYM